MRVLPFKDVGIQPGSAFFLNFMAINKKYLHYLFQNIRNLKVILSVDTIILFVTRCLYRSKQCVYKSRRD